MLKCLRDSSLIGEKQHVEEKSVVHRLQGIGRVMVLYELKLGTVKPDTVAARSFGIATSNSAGTGARRDRRR
jgi:hypothetical protein